MPQVKQASKRKRRTKAAVSALGARRIDLLTIGKRDSIGGTDGGRGADNGLRTE